MSIEFDIFPTIKNHVRWGDLKNLWTERVNDSLSELQNFKPILRLAGPDKIVADEEKLLPGNPYYVDLDFPNTLGIVPMFNKGNLDELEYLEDYGRNLPPQIVHEYAEKWREAGHWYEVSSTMGRGRNESRLMIALSASIAELCKGCVIVMHHEILDLDIGIYTPEQFTRAQPKF